MFLWGDSGRLKNYSLPLLSSQKTLALVSLTLFNDIFVYPGRFLGFLLIAFRNDSIFRWQVDFAHLMKYIFKMELLAVFGKRITCVCRHLWRFGTNFRLFFGADEERWNRNWIDICHRVIDVPGSWQQGVRLHVTHKESILRECFWHDRRWLFFSKQGQLWFVSGEIRTSFGCK